MVTPRHALKLHQLLLELNSQQRRLNINVPPAALDDCGRQPFWITGETAR